ncbi:cyclic nucleotide-binding domain protein (macronuclear) [Tetrahymena thermophila SB210]|uniref:Cyclic nucleotide-binding domain protein n=1 Tax=Tetrahymena thermophila (strain SB210) TaxID=312017 RepID=I7M663_TETTS|nr:cyclic nucleotide-binding domain protein [Tetrahymena thermophila SB210]EAR84430.2 cyclic nucleotide-binding domain protein [Tetrahymena thermophila SB210]|eukprot:XP_001032093.2 cyclic nucleotide-binding domain protein [Tetrahymena thermophila SB210]
MRNRDIPKHLQTKVFKNLEYSHILEGSLIQKSEIILDNLTLTLRNQIKIEFYGRILQNYKLFNLNFSQEVRQELCLHMKEIILQPGEILYDIGQNNDKIFFLHKGSVEIISFNFNKQNSSTIGIAQSGSMLGQLGFFTGQLEILQAKSIDTCFLIYCDRSSFQQIISKNSYDMEIFCKLRDNLLIYNRQFETTCYCCQKVGHETSQCQIYGAKIVKQISIWKHLKWFQQERDSSHQRKKKKSINSLKCRNEYMTQARKLRLLYFYYAYDYDFQIQQEDLELEQNDMEFLLFIPKIFYKDGEYEYSEGEISNFSDRYYDELKKEYDLYPPKINSQRELQRQETQKPEDSSNSQLSEPRIQSNESILKAKQQLHRQSLNLNQFTKKEFFKQQKNKTQPLQSEKEQMQVNFTMNFNNLQNKLFQKSNSKGNQNNSNKSQKNKKNNSLSRIEEYQMPSGEIQYNSEVMFSDPKLNTPRINLTNRNLADIIERQQSSSYQEESKSSINKNQDVLKICKSQNEDFQNITSNQRLSIDKHKINRISIEHSRNSFSRGQRPSILFGLNQISSLQKQLRLSNDKNIPIQEIADKENKDQDSSQSLTSKSSSASSYSQTPNQVRVKTVVNFDKVNEAMQILQERRSNQISQFYLQYYDGIYIVPDFDKVKEYTGYYPYNNFSKVMKQLREKQYRLFRKQKLSRTVIRDNKKKFTEIQYAQQ